MPDEPGLLPVIQSHRRQETGDTPNKLTSYQHMVSSDFKLVASNLGKYLASTSDYTCTYIQMHTHHVFRPMPKKISVSYLFNCRDRFWIHRKKKNSLCYDNNCDMQIQLSSVTSSDLGYYKYLLFVFASFLKYTVFYFTVSF